MITIPSDLSGLDKRQLQDLAQAATEQLMPSCNGDFIQANRLCRAQNPALFAAIDKNLDRRPLASGNFRKQDFRADEKLIRDTAILHGGNESLAHRELRQAGQLSEAFVSHYAFDARRNKSYLPRAVREAIALVKNGKRRRGRPPQAESLAIDARLLKVSVSHLWRVRKGQRFSARLSAADAALQALRQSQSAENSQAQRQKL